MLLCADSHERLRRANRHANTFVNAYIRFFHDDPKPFGISHKMRDDRNGVILLVPQKTIKGDLPLVLGEFFYQLSAALDCAMWRAYEKLGSTNSTGKLDEERLYFPICKTSGQFKNATFNSIPLPHELKDWLASIQPCNAHDLPTGSEDEAIAESLKTIHRFAARDRHRKPRIVATVVSQNTALIECTPPARITYIQNLVAAPVEGQYEIAAFGIEGMTAETELNVDGNFSVGVAVEDVGSGSIEFTRLHALKDDVMRTIQRFDRGII